MVEVLLEFLADDDAAEDALLVAEEAHDGAGGDGDDGVEAWGGEAIFWSWLGVVFLFDGGGCIEGVESAGLFVVIDWLVGHY